MTWASEARGNVLECASALALSARASESGGAPPHSKTLPRHVMPAPGITRRVFRILTMTVFSSCALSRRGVDG
jgi:hypothetical protein